MRRDTSQILQTTPLNNITTQGHPPPPPTVRSTPNTFVPLAAIRILFCQPQQKQNNRRGYKVSRNSVNCYTFYSFRNVRVLNPGGQMCYIFSLRVAAALPPRRPHGVRCCRCAEADASPL